MPKAAPRKRAEGVAPPVDRRHEVLRVLTAASEPLSIIAIADELGVHPNTVRLHLDVLVAKGRVELVAPEHRAPGRPPLLFRAIPGMDPTGPRHYQLLAEVLAASLATGPNPAVRATRAGRAWGRRLAAQPGTGGVGAAEPIERLVELLNELDFAPERRETDGRAQVGLRNCPFLELARTRAGVICPLHLGLMQGAMDAWDAPVTVDRLEAFVEPDLCLAHLAPVGGDG
jgi:predicted ArsR family transcriptional regulator